MLPLRSISDCLMISSSLPALVVAAGTSTSSTPVAVKSCRAFGSGWETAGGMACWSVAKPDSLTNQSSQAFAVALFLEFLLTAPSLSPSMEAWNLPPLSYGKGQKPMSSGLAPTDLAASCICGTAQEPSSNVAILPAASAGLELSQLV